MRAWRPEFYPAALGLALSVIACADPDSERTQPTSAPDGSTTVSGATALDAASAVGSDAGSTSRDAGGAPSNTSGAQPEAGTRTDAGQSPRDAGTSPSDASAGPSDAGNVGSGNEAGANLGKFSFFVTSLSAMRMLSGNRNGFGGDLRHGETGEGAGLRGADKICAETAELGMPGSSAKQWRAFLSTTTVNARTRIGMGPWYDRNGRLVAMNLTALMMERPMGAPAEIRDDLPNERGEANRAGSAEGAANDNHDVITGTNPTGDYDGANSCDDWTSTTALSDAGTMGLRGPRIGHSWPAGSGRHWAAAHYTQGCAPSVSLTQGGGGPANGIGNLGGYGAIYCFALTP